MKPILISAADRPWRPTFVAKAAILTLSAALELTVVQNAEAAGKASTGIEIAYPMDASHWTMAPPIRWAAGTAGLASFVRDEGMPLGKMTLNEGIAVLDAGSFSSGEIDFDVKPLGYNDAGVIFHRHGEDEGEFVYIRANPDCPAAQDCVQYAPITHGLMAWNIYPNYQAPAPISVTGWNHITIQAADGKMRVFLNHAATPSIVVARLLGLATDGGIAFKGPAVFANLVVRPDAHPDMSGVTYEPAAAGTVTAWFATAPTSRDRARPVTARDIPATSAWHPIEAEPTGLADLGRAYGTGKAPSLSTGWLKTVVTAAAPMRRVIDVGFAMQVSVFLNGRLVYTGNNPYYPEQDRLSPGGRLQIDNATIPLNLRQGKNEVVLAVGNNWRADQPMPKPSPYGWAAEARFERSDGLAF